MKLDSRELATVLAALRYWQSSGKNPHCVEIAMDCPGSIPLTLTEIDSLCERLNCETTIDEEPDEETLAIIEQARDRTSNFGDDIEIYDDADVSESGDPGYWVEAYVWVPKEDDEEDNDEDDE